MMDTTTASRTPARSPACCMFRAAAVKKAVAPPPEWRVTLQRLIDDPDLHVTARPAVYQLAVDVHPGDPL